MFDCFLPRRRDPLAERVIGDRAPYEMDARQSSSTWVARALQVGPARLAEAARDDKAALDHHAKHNKLPELM